MNDHHARGETGDDRYVDRRPEEDVDGIHAAAGPCRPAPLARDALQLSPRPSTRATKGMRYPADPPTVEEIIAVMRAAGDSSEGIRLRGVIVVL